MEGTRDFFGRAVRYISRRVQVRYHAAPSYPSTHSLTPPRDFFQYIEIPLFDYNSFGIVMWEIVARDEPYRAMGYRWMREIKEAVLAKVRPALPRGVAKTYRDLMRKCWSADPSRRPAFSEVVQRLTQMSAHGYGEVQTQVVGSSP